MESDVPSFGRLRRVGMVRDAGKMVRDQTVGKGEWHVKEF